MNNITNRDVTLRLRNDHTSKTAGCANSGTCYFEYALDMKSVYLKVENAEPNDDFSWMGPCSAASNTHGCSLNTAVQLTITLTEQ